MADTFSAPALRGYTLHTPKGFVIFNEGRTTRFIPNEFRARLEAEGVIPKVSTAEAGAAAKPRSTRKRKAKKAPARPAAAKAPPVAPAGAGEAPPAD